MTQFAGPEKAVLLALESAEHPLHLGVVQVFRPPEGAGRGYARETYEAMRACTDVARTFAGHPAKTRRGTSMLRWTYDSGIDIDDHLSYVSLPAPGSSHELFSVLGDLHSRMVDRRKPLWAAHLIDGLEDGRFAVYIKAHHALSDGVSGAKVIEGALSTDPHDTQVRVSWAPQPHVRVANAPRGTRSKRGAGMAHTVSEARRAVLLLREALGERDLIPAYRAPKTIFNAAAGGPRCCAVQSWPLHRITEVATAAGVTVNDVALAMSAGALRGYLEERNALPDRPLVAMVPVDLRDAKDFDEGNILGGAICSLATDLDDPAKRLESIHRSMRRNVQIIKDLPRALAIQLPGILVAPMPGVPPAFNLAISHMRGTEKPLYRNGARLENTYPLAPTLRGQTLNFGLFSNGDSVDFGLAGSASAVPDLDRMLGHLEISLKDLERAVSP